MRKNTISKMSNMLALSVILLTFAFKMSSSAFADENEPVEYKTRAGAITVEVDPRVELIAIVFRLAGNPEYHNGTLRPYEKAVEKHFGDFDTHPAVKMAAKLRLERSMSCDGPMSLAVHIDRDYRLRKKIEPWPDTLDGRWNAENVEEFLEKLRDFAVKTRFDEFFEAQRGIYEKGMASCIEMVGPLEVNDWLKEYFGVADCGDLRLVLGFVNGFSNYGTRFVDGRVNEKYAIVGMRPFDAANTVMFNGMQIGTLMHEFCHSFINPVVKKHLYQLRHAGEKLFAAHGPAMRMQGYQKWESVMYETAVRACVGAFVRHKFEPVYTGYYLDQEKHSGFVWTEDMSNFLKKYESNRAEYPTFESFFPEFVKYLDNYTSKKAVAQF